MLRYHLVKLRGRDRRRRTLDVGLRREVAFRRIRVLRGRRDREQNTQAYENRAHQPLLADLFDTVNQPGWRDFS
jgi:hypothetical protein